MEPARKGADQLREQILRAEIELKALKDQLAEVEAGNKDGAGQGGAREEGETAGTSRSSRVEDGCSGWKWSLGADEYERYGRQLILPQVGIHGQRRLKTSKVLIIGAGGLGCPAAAYLAGAGVGTLGFVDGDVVEPSNLHRQIAHGTSRVGMLKVDSLVQYCRELNPLPKYIPHREHLSPENAEDIVRGYDLVLDCTDHPTSRYLISDICILLQKPLVSASALRTDGQLILLNAPPTPQGIVNPPDQPTLPPPSPCYRCVFPKPPPPGAVVSCGEGGVLGPVVGVMGVLQALEAIKVIAAGLHIPRNPSSSTSPPELPSPSPPLPQPTLLLFSGATVGAPSFRSMRMRARRRDCFACGEGSPARLTFETLRSGSLDYVAFCGGILAPVAVLEDEQRVSAAKYHDMLKSSSKGEDHAHVLLDVRERELFDIASIEGAINVPYSTIQRISGKRKGNVGDDVHLDWMPKGLATGDQSIYVVCRVGNDSQVVAKQLIDLGLGRNGRWIGDIKGGMRAWRDEVDRTLPFL
ncbi:hypothetical protein M406DRAFT_263841 [Cryphonectria parasitica EP155]|uniref:Adenylyltransferase and sulfurtransferase uba4 n=1 Tax=Cryphonectria parasitica (strain ATCC 38755 / EP155) TaxID=660469 RepID=A0A9P4XXJ0_CRYP1|nr:uncharacterized protein M406DRAFT_263841 [Cryphonectria parasitica EP155]KAF3762749.1 hypothetical protein M406DRAFT_263841 [Cryphonectria parasitica EP155]